jgi:hypothetical protein
VAGASAAAAPSLSRLKRERSQLAGRLERMAAARAELEVDDIDDGQRSAEADIAGAFSAWVQSGCDGQRPFPNAALASSIARRREAARAELEANRAPLAELLMQADAIRARLEAIDAEITAEAVSALASDLESEMAAIGAAADELNAALGRALGLQIFALGHRGTRGFMRLVEQLLALSTPEIGSTKIQIEVAAAEWRSKFAEMVR